jgi:hypothetical protein
MKTFMSEGREIQLPDIGVVSSESAPRFEIKEGDFKGIQFTITNIRMDDKDEALMWYDLNTATEGDQEKIKPIVDDFILSILYEQIERPENENDSSSDPNT